ncbi:hypothetical protein EB061_07750 [bacterium]|nr:hypothetical protein [bacterium]
MAIEGGFENGLLVLRGFDLEPGNHDVGADLYRHRWWNGGVALQVVLIFCEDFPNLRKFSLFYGQPFDGRSAAGRTGAGRMRGREKKWNQQIENQDRSSRCDIQKQDTGSRSGTQVSGQISQE